MEDQKMLVIIVEDLVILGKFCPNNNNNKNNWTKQIIMTIFEVMIIEPPSDNWWIDSGATHHITRSKELFIDLKEKKIGEYKVYMRNDTYSDVLGERNCKLSINGIVVNLSNVLYVPSVCRNLIFVSVLDKKGYEIKLKSDCVTICKGKVKLKRVRIDDMYVLNSNIYNKDSVCSYSIVSNSSYLWHLWLWHISKNKIERISKTGILPNLNIENFDVCESCIKGNMTTKPFAKHWQSSELLELIHSDICGPLRTKTHKSEALKKK